MKRTHPIPTPSDFCDNRCERCPLVWECDKCADVHVHPLRSRDKPSELFTDDVLVTEVGATAKRRGRRSTHVNPERGSRLRHVANAYYAAVDEVVSPSLTDEEASLADEIYACTLSLVATCWRIADAAEHTLTTARWRSLEPLLLLVDELEVRNRGLLQRMREEFDAIRYKWLQDTQQLLADTLRPMVDHVSPEARTELAKRMLLLEAPSPFCKVWPDWYERLASLEAASLEPASLEADSEPAVDGDHLAV